MDSNFKKGFAGQTALAIAALIAGTICTADAAQTDMQAAACFLPGTPAPKELVGIAKGDLGHLTVKKGMLITIKNGSCVREKVSERTVDLTPTTFERANEKYLFFDVSDGKGKKFIAADLKDVQFN